MSKIKIFMLNTLVVFISSLLLQIIGLGFNVYISNKIGQEALGVFSLILSVYMFGITLASAGINIATTRVVSEELAVGDESSCKRAATRCVIISLIAGIIASFIFLIFDDFIVHICFHNKVDKSIIYLICVALPFISMSSAINGYFVGVRRVQKNAVAKFFEEFVKIASSAFLLSTIMPVGINSACFSLILGDVISEILSFIYLYFLYVVDKNKNSPLSRFKNIDSYNKRILRISLPVALTSYLRSGLGTLKQILVPSSLERSGLSCSDALSKYGLIGGMAMPIIMFSSIFVNSFAGLLVPEFSRYYVKKDFKRIRSVTIFILVLTTIFSVLLSILFFVFAPKICLLIYNNNEVVKYVRFLSPLIVFICLDIVIDSILKGLDAQVSVMTINIIDCLISIFFIYFVVPIFGLNGFIFSIIVSELLNFTLSLFKLLSYKKTVT